MRIGIQFTLLVLCGLSVSGCTTLSGSDELVAPLSGPKITRNKTEFHDSLVCASQKLAKTDTGFSRKPRVVIDQIPDLSGKINSTEGTKISQGVDHMAVTALQSFSSSIDIVERSILNAFNVENNLTRQQLVGDGVRRQVAGQKNPLNFKPLFKGNIYSADYFITGAITEVNYNLFSGGGVLGISNVNFGKRKVALNVGIDLRIVNMHNLKVEDALTLEKQFIGERLNGDALRFVDSELLSLDGGASRDEPIQRGVRAMIERGISALLGSVMGVSLDACFQPKSPELNVASVR